MKKRVPLTVLENIKDLANQNRHLIKIHKDEDAILHFKDIDDSSSFYFKIKSLNIKGGKTSYSVEYKPFNKDNFEVRNYGYDISQVKSNFNNWIGLLKGYSESDFYFSDPILQHYQKELENDFKLIDEDADYAPFDIERQLWLNDYLEKVIEIVEKKKTKENEIEIIEIITEAKDLQKDVPKSTKNQVVRRLRKIWAKSWKIGTNVIKELFIDFTTELAKKLIKGE